MRPDPGAGPWPGATVPALRLSHLALVLGCVAGGLLLAQVGKEAFLAPLGIVAGAAAAWQFSGGRQGGLARLGFRRPASVWSTALAAGILILAMFGVSRAAGRVIIPRWGPPDYSQLAAMTGHAGRIALLFLVNWSTAAFGEEMIFRGYLIPGIASWLPGRVAGRVLAVVLSTLLFALVHSYQGISGMALTGVTGLVLAVGYAVGDGTLWRTILAHGLFNTVGLTQLFLQLSR